MSIKYKVVERGQPGVSGGGNKKWYATISTDGETSVDELVAQIEKFSSLSEADIRGVIIALENAIQHELANGKIVRLDKLGSLYPTLSSNPANQEKDFHAGLIKSIGVNYRAGKRILDAMKNAGFGEKHSRFKTKLPQVLDETCGSFLCFFYTYLIISCPKTSLMFFFSCSCKNSMGIFLSLASSS